jgi:hypothetical protein
MYALAEEENIVEMLTPWEMEFNKLEGWLNNPKQEDGCHEIVMPKETCHHEEQLE